MATTLPHSLNHQLLRPEPHRRRARRRHLRLAEIFVAQKPTRARPSRAAQIGPENRFFTDDGWARALQQFGHLCQRR
jgi:hypothetical protein